MLYLILHFTCLGSSATQVSKQTLIFILKGRIRIKQLQKYPIIVIPARLQHVQRLTYRVGLSAVSSTGLDKVSSISWADFESEALKCSCAIQ